MWALVETEAQGELKDCETSTGQGKWIKKSWFTSWKKKKLGFFLAHLNLGKLWGIRKGKNRYQEFLGTSSLFFICWFDFIMYLKTADFATDAI